MRDTTNQYAQANVEKRKARNRLTRSPDWRSRRDGSGTRIYWRASIRYDLALYTPLSLRPPCELAGETVRFFV
jgi:hypothetical protein